MRQGKRLFQTTDARTARRIKRTIVAPSVFMGSVGESVTGLPVGVSPITGNIERLSIHLIGLPEQGKGVVDLHVGGRSYGFTIDKEKDAIMGPLPVFAGELIAISAALPMGVSLAYGGVLVMARSECVEYQQEDSDV